MLALLLLIFIALPAYAHEGEEHDDAPSLHEIINDWVFRAVAVGGAVSVLACFLAILRKRKTEKEKRLLFFLISAPIIIVTLFLASSTIYLNVISESKGPVHWHADFEIWFCDEQMDVVDPSGISNRVGSSVFHEHGDDRIHVEGVLEDVSDASLQDFFRVIGGYMSDDSLTIPTESGLVAVKNGGLCNGESSVLQVFVYKTIRTDEGLWKYSVEKLSEPEGYVLSPFSSIPPGDCLIVEFSPESESTTHICETYSLAIEQGRIMEEGS